MTDSVLAASGLRRSPSAVPGVILLFFLCPGSLLILLFLACSSPPIHLPWPSASPVKKWIDKIIVKDKTKYIASVRSAKL